MQRILLFILLFFTVGLAKAQVVNSRDNNTGFWNRRSSWMQEWSGRTNTLPLPVATVNVYGYLAHGTLSASADMTLSGSGSVMRVYDTLRVHGNFSVVSTAHLIIESTGVLIVHGHYNQQDWGRLTIHGTMIVLGDLKLVGNTQRSENFGRLYVGGSSGTGGWPLNPKTTTQLASEDPLTSFFSTSNIVASHCTGTNSGTLTVTNPTTRSSIVRWEVSNDFFKSDIRNITNRNNQYTYSNLTRTTTYRVYFNMGDGTFSYSNGATVIINKPSVAGTISGQSEVCGSAASIPLRLNDNTGDVVRWEWSYDNFITAPQSVVTSSETLTLTNVNSTVYIRAVVGGCGEVTTPTFIITVQQPIAVGTVVAPAAVCAGSNSGTVRLQNWQGSIVRWERSTDGFRTVTSIANTTSTLNFTNLTQNTSYRVVLNNGSVCTESFTSIAEVQVIQNLTEATLAVSELQTPTAGLIAHYPFIKNASDASGSGNHGILIGATPVTDRFGRANNAFSFDGVDDYITTSSSFPAPGPNQFSLSLWFRTSSTTGGKLIGAGRSQIGESKNYDRHIYMNNTGQLYFGVFQDDQYPNGHKLINTTAAFNDNQWHHVVATLSPAGIKLYVDGVLRASNTTTTYGENYGGFWRMGYDGLFGWPSAPSNLYFSGTLDDVSIYNRELTQSEVSQLQTVNVGPYCQGQNVQLKAVTVPGGTYAWTGPGGFTSSIQNPLLTNLQAAQAGTYTVTVTVGSCKYVGSTTVALSNNGTVTASQSPVCAGTNSGSLRLANHTGSIVRWERSTDNFASNVVAIANTTADLTYSNLTATTSYRAVLNSLACGEGFSTVATVEVMPPSQGGSLSGPASVCKGTNSGTLTLSGHVGQILNWEYSDDGFVAHSQSIVHTATTFTFSNLSASRWYRVVVKNGVCNQTYSTVFKITVTEIAGGTLSGPERVCANSNSGTISLAGHLGTILRWEWSNDGFQSHVQTLAHTQADYTFTNIAADTWYRAIVGNAECGETASTIHLIRTDAVSQGGSLTGPAAVCKGTNSGTLTLSGHVGQILNWEYSDDGFVAHSQIVASTASTLTFSNLTANRWYKAVVKSGVCNAASSTIFKVSVTELAGGTISGPASVCESANTGVLQLANYVGTIKRWEWSNDGFQNHIITVANSQASYTFSNLTGDTWFRAIVGNAECGEKVSAIYVVRYDLLSLGGTISGTSSVCKGTNSGTLNLAGHRGKILRWEYSTDNFVSHSQSIANTSTIHTFSNLTASRWYRVVVQNGSCAAVNSPSFKITVAELAGGTISGPTAVCLGENSGSLSLQAYLGNVIRWEISSDNFAGNVVSVNQSTATYAFTNLTADTWFRAVVGNAECGETFSAVWKVAVDLPSLGGDLTGSASFCSLQNSGTLNLVNQQGSILRWEASTDDFTSNIQTITNSTTTHSFLNLQQTTSFRAVVQNASCPSAYSAVAKIVVEAPSQAGAVSGAASACYGTNSGVLALQSKVGAVLRWESSTDGFATVTAIDNTSDEISYKDLTLTTAFRAVVQNGFCDPVFSQAATISVSAAAQGGSVMGSSMVAAGNNSGELQLQEYSGEILYWESSLDGFIADISPISNTTALHNYLNLNQTTWYRAVVQGGSCGMVFSSSAKIGVNHAPLAQNDTLQVQAQHYIATVSVLVNDQDPDDDNLQVVPTEGQTAAGGYARLDADGILYYEPPTDFFGYDSLRYTVCDGVTGAPLCAEATIVLDLSLPVVVYQGVSPNNDGDNDIWYISFIDRYPNNLVQLYDRYGALVYEQRGYNNQDRSFAGKGNRGIRVGEGDLPEGTYFYKIVTSTQAPVLQGYIVLKK